MEHPAPHSYKSNKSVMMVFAAPVEERRYEQLVKKMTSRFERVSVIFLNGEPRQILFSNGCPRHLQTKDIPYETAFRKAKSLSKEIIENITAFPEKMFYFGSVSLEPAFDKSLLKRLMQYVGGFLRLEDALKDEHPDSIFIYTEDLFERALFSSLKNVFPQGAFHFVSGFSLRRAAFFSLYIKGWMRLFRDLAYEPRPPFRHAGRADEANASPSAVFLDDHPLLLERMAPLFKRFVEQNWKVTVVGFGKTRKSGWEQAGLASRVFGNHPIGFRLLLERWRYILRFRKVYRKRGFTPHSEKWNEMRRYIACEETYRIIYTYQKINQALSDLQPEAILFTNRQVFGTLIGLVARASGIPAVWIQEAGHFLQTAMSVNNEHLIADYFLVWGDVSRETLVEGGIDRDKIFITGALMFENLLKEARDITVGQRCIFEGDKERKEPVCRVLLISVFPSDGAVTNPQPSSRLKEDILKAVGNVMKDIPSAVLVIKPHPFDENGSSFDEKIIGAILPRSQYEIASSASDLVTLVKESDAMFLMHGSTAGLYAVLFGKPIVMMSEKSNLAFNLFVEEKMSVYAATPADIKDALHSALFDKETQDRLFNKRNEFLDRYLSVNNEGLPSENISTFLKERVLRT
ncbi:MAG: hypothetical protein JW844_01160 [Candidatus Omnitrophica bacterium]|nr:hypothetical protein [Candidatus Omnitrophota bacterium]